MGSGEGLVAFLNHGHLPFAGRGAELERIDRFRREIVDSWGCRTLLFTGEAGSGKSRLVDRAIETAEQGERPGIILRLRFRPESITDLFSLIAGTLETAPHARDLVALPSDPTPEAVLRSITRLCRLRPTLLFLEDLHLVDGDEVMRDVARFLEGVRDDPIGIVGTARPASIPVRPLFATTLIDEIPLGPLDRAGIEEITAGLFGEPGPAEAIDLLTDATRGNPLALRSALRRAVGREAIVVGQSGWSVSEEFRSIVTTSADDVAEGLLAGLSSDDRRGAARLAALGEIFAAEAAEQLVGDPELVERLGFRGVISRTSIAAGRLSGSNPSARPLLGFTHTLLHDRLLRELDRTTGQIIGPLVTLLIDDLPLHTVIPFRLIADALSGEEPVDLSGVELSSDNLSSLATRIGREVSRIDHTSDWRFGMTMLDAVEGVIRNGSDDRAFLFPLVPIFDMRLRLMRREARSAEYRSILESYDRLTADPQDEPSGNARMACLVGRFFWLCESTTGADGAEQMPAALEGIAAVLAEVDTLIDRFLPLRGSRSYAQILGIRLSWSLARNHDPEELAEIRRRFEEMIADEATPPMTRLRMRIRGLPEFLDGLDEEGRLERIAEVEEIEGSPELPPPMRPFLGEMKRHLLHRTADYRRLLPVLGEMRRHYDESGENPISFTYAAEIDAARILLGAEPQPIVADFLVRLENAVGVASHYRRSSLREILYALLLVEDRDHLPVVFDRLSAIDGAESENHDLLDRLATLRIAEDHDAESALESDDDNPIAVVSRHHASDLLLRLESTENPAPIVAGLFDFYEARGLRGAMIGLLDRRGEEIDEKVVRKLRKRIDAVETIEETGSTHNRREGKPFRMHICGTIDLIRPDNDRFNPRGERLKLLLGTMVADRMLPQPLEREEFLQIVTGLDDEPKRRRDMTNMAISRLRGGLGESETILYDGETPQLNLDLIAVDLLDASDRITSARSALADDVLLRAAPALEEAIELWSGEVPFPGLYDDLFENLRSRFEADLRETTLICAERLAEAGDTTTASTLLSLLARAMPGDEEIGERLGNVR